VIKISAEKLDNRLGVSIGIDPSGGYLFAIVDIEEYEKNQATIKLLYNYLQR